MKCIYIVLGYQDLNGDGNLTSNVYGAFSTEELARECIGFLTEELEFLNHCEIEAVPIDEFGYR